MGDNFLPVIFFIGMLIAFVGGCFSFYMWSGGELNTNTILDGKFVHNIEGDNFVCINIKPNMTFERMIDVCVHEAAHSSYYSEQFAEICENNATKCLEVFE